MSYPRERALVNRRRRLGAVATISHPLLALIPRASRLPTCQTVGIVFEYVAYLLSGSLLGYTIVRTREKEHHLDRRPPSTVSQLSLPFSLEQEEEEEEEEDSLRGDAPATLLPPSLPSPPRRERAHNRAG